MNQGRATFAFAFLQFVQAFGVTNFGARRRLLPAALLSLLPPLLDSPAAPQNEVVSDCTGELELDWGVHCED